MVIIKSLKFLWKIKILTYLYSLFTNLSWLDDFSPLFSDKWTWSQQSIGRFWPHRLYAHGITIIIIIIIIIILLLLLKLFLLMTNYKILFMYAWIKCSFRTGTSFYYSVQTLQSSYFEEFENYLCVYNRGGQPAASEPHAGLWRIICCFP